MQFLVIYQPPQRFAEEGMPDDFVEIEGHEEVRAQELYAEGSLRHAWGLDTATRGAAVIFEADSADRLEQINASFPLVQRGYSVFEVYPLTPYPGFTPKR